LRRFVDARALAHGPQHWEVRLMTDKLEARRRPHSLHDTRHRSNRKVPDRMPLLSQVSPSPNRDLAAAGGVGLHHARGHAASGWMLQRDNRRRGAVTHQDRRCPIGVIHRSSQILGVHDRHVIRQIAHLRKYSHLDRKRRTRGVDIQAGNRYPQLRGDEAGFRGKPHARRTAAGNHHPDIGYLEVRPLKRHTAARYPVSALSSSETSSAQRGL
jgi:hypothetical protein